MRIESKFTQLIYHASLSFVVLLAENCFLQASSGHLLWPVPTVCDPRCGTFYAPCISLMFLMIRAHFFDGVFCGDGDDGGVPQTRSLKVRNKSFGFGYRVVILELLF